MRGSHGDEDDVLNVGYDDVLSILVALSVYENTVTHNPKTKIIKVTIKI